MATTNEASMSACWPATALRSRASAATSMTETRTEPSSAETVSNARRMAQARRVRAIYDQLSQNGTDHIAICGDFNDTPDSAPLAPLLADGSDLKDISEHPHFADGGRPGTFGNGTKGNKIDYILLSPALFAKVTAGGIFRKGVWGGKNGTLWEIYPEITNVNEAASDHAAIWADLDL